MAMTLKNIVAMTRMTTQLISQEAVEERVVEQLCALPCIRGGGISRNLRRRAREDEDQDTEDRAAPEPFLHCLLRALEEVSTREFIDVKYHDINPLSPPSRMNSGICQFECVGRSQRDGQYRVEAAQHEGHRRRGDQRRSAAG